MYEDWQEEYHRKLVTAEEAVKAVKSGDRVCFTYGSEPLSLGLALAARKEDLRDVTVFVRAPARDFGWYDPGWEDAFKVEISFVLPMVREMMAEHRCDMHLNSLLGLDPVDPVVCDIDVALTEVSPPNEHGFCSFGASVWDKRKQLKGAKIILAEVNPNVVRTAGDNFIHVSEISYFVEHASSGRMPGATDLLGRKTQEPGELEKRIAAHVAALVQDGDTLQIGVGSTSEWVARLGAFDHKRDLGWHSETTPRGIIKLVREGVITGKRKTLNQGKFVAVAVGGGTKEDMDFVDGNPIFELYDGEYVLNPSVVGAHDNMVAINSAISVDLTGQVSAESVGTTILSGPGGQLAFAIGARLSRGGRFINTVLSTARGGSVSRIVPVLEPGTIVTVPRTLSDMVVTEYGVARLRGKTQRERAQALIQIAHPDFRAELEKEAKRLYWP